MNFPPLAPFPPPELQATLPPAEWYACLEAWITLTQLHLRISAKAFSSTSARDESLIAFLVSYMSHNALTHHPTAPLSESPKDRALRRNGFLLSHRLLSEVDPPDPLLHWTFLADLSAVYRGSEALVKLLQTVWKKNEKRINSDLLNIKSQLIAALESATLGSNTELETLLRRLHPLWHASFELNACFMLGSEFLDALCTGHDAAAPQLKWKILDAAYLSLTSLVKGDRPNPSLLLDHLYDLKRTAQGQLDSSQKAKALLKDLVTHTSLLRRIKDRMEGKHRARAGALLADLEQYRSSSGAQPRRRLKGRLDNGKGPENRNHDLDGYHPEAHGDVHVHRMSLISQIQDLFPDLGAGFVIRLLDEYGDDIEKVTAHLLDDSLPPHLRDADRNETLNLSQNRAEPHSGLIPTSTPPVLPTRHNIFDDDDLDRLAVDASRLHVGRKNPDRTADDMLRDRSSAPNKAAILSALAAFDSDDDERDDTYDVADVGGTVDTTDAGGAPDDDERANNLDPSTEETLFATYKGWAAIFRRDATTRRSQARASLRNETGLSDEAIEGWAYVLGKDPSRLRRLEDKYARLPARKSFTEFAGSDDAEDSIGEGGGAEGSKRGRGGYRGRGRGRGSRGQGNVTGPSADRDTQVSRQRKEASKSSRANHNRRDQRAKKMARGMGP